MATTWRWGVLLDERTADMLDETQRLSGVSLTATQGCYSGGVEASAGTHDGGGAVDLSASGLNQGEKDAVLLAGRRVGFALWHRTPSQGNWPYHFHGIAGGCPDLSSGARDQWNDFLAGRNGLANNAPDDGPRDFHYVGILWEEYLAGGGKDSEEDEDMFICEAPNRGAGLFAPGYYLSLTLEQRDVLTDLGVRRTTHNDRGYDVARAAMLQGQDSVNTD